MIRFQHINTLLHYSLIRDSFVWMMCQMRMNILLNAMRYAWKSTIYASVQGFLSTNCTTNYYSIVVAACSAQIAVVNGHGIFHCKSLKLQYLKFALLWAHGQVIMP